ncbi:hypothetical protein [Sulfitobacter sp. 20_GPM-1509m]|uniref:hypothetical protein n=1 Tax=Sulfitobacter sp. 20_GPM-1509m TaxID=1380367 RepID=UPI0004902C2F|nr:hypothetical protein [Sulfitobacter sp. 20_GPM-1509m]
MATFDEIMAAAVNADKAGDTQAAQMLVNAAREMRDGAVQQQANQPGTFDPASPDFVVPRGDVVTPTTGNEDRFGDTIRAATEGPIAATKAYAGGLADQSQSPTMAALPDWMADPAKKRLAYAGDAAMTGLAAAGTAISFGAGLAGEAFGGSPTGEKQLARDLLMGAEVAVPELAGGSSVMRAASRAGRAAEKVAAPNEMQARARAASDLGITPSLGAGGKVRAMTAATLEKTPLAGAPIAKDAARFVGEVESAFSDITSRVGQASTAADAGGALQSGLKSFVKGFREKAGQLYGEVGKAIPDGTLIKAPETVASIRDAIAPFANSPEIAKQLGLNRWAAIADDLESGLSWRAASDLRSSIGESLGKVNGALADMDQGKLKQAYEKLTVDLEMAAKAAGPEAESAWRRANTYYRRGAERIQNDLDRTISADSPERAFEAFAAMAKADRATSNSTRLYKIKSSMPADKWREVASTIVDRLGRPSAGQQNAAGDVFSPSSFLTQWNQISDEAKRVLLPEEVRVQLGKLAQVSEGVKAANAERNFSNTGTIVAGATAGSALAAAPVTTAAILSGAWGSAKAMTSPVFLRALNNAARGDARAMRAMANGNGPFSQDAMTILRLSAADAANGGNAANSNQPRRMAQ